MLDVIKRILTTEPAIVRGIGTAVIAVGTAAGLDIAGSVDRGVAILIALIGLVAVLQAWWTRTAVTPTATVAEYVDTAGRVIAGPANDLVRQGEAVREVGEETEPIWADDAEDDLAYDTTED